MSLSNNGGKPAVRDVMNYAQPTGRKTHPASPGLAGGDNYGCCGTQGGDGGSASTSGGVGIGGDATRCNGGVQGRR